MGATATATMAATMVTTMARGLLMLSPAMATTDTAMVLDTVTATMADTVTTMARGLLRPSLRLPLPLLPRLRLSPAMATTDTVTATPTTAVDTTTTVKFWLSDYNVQEFSC